MRMRAAATGLLIFPVIVVVGGCGAPAESAAVATTSTLSTTTVTTAASTSSTTPKPAQNDRGNIVKHFGEEGGLSDPDQGRSTPSRSTRSVTAPETIPARLTLECIDSSHG